MSDSTRSIRTDAFVYYGSNAGAEFCEKFLHSREFAAKNLKEFLTGTSTLNKGDLAKTLAEYVANSGPDKNFAKTIMTHFATQPRQWLAVKYGKRATSKKYNQAKIQGPFEDLLTKMGEAGWYGPLEADEGKQHFIRSVKLPFRQFGSTLDQPSGTLRWHVIAEIGDDYMALTWKGFTFTGLAETISPSQFEYYRYIPILFDELEEIVDGNWENVDLHKFVLETIWDKYSDDSQYYWRDRRIRSDIDGVIFTAHSIDPSDKDKDDDQDQEEPIKPSKNNETDVKGLRSLSRRLANAAFFAVPKESITPANPKEKIAKKMEVYIRRSLIHHLGTKSYEFSLDKLSSKPRKSIVSAVERELYFRAHCYFGVSDAAQYTKEHRKIFRSKGYIDGSSVDGLRHLKCYVKYGNSVGALRFLLEHLRES